MMDRSKALYDYLANVRASYPRLSAGRFAGNFDCALFAAGWVNALTGSDPSTNWRGRYQSFDQGRALLADHGHASLGDLAASHLIEVDGWALSAPGDIAVLSEDGHDAFGIIGGPQIHVLTPRRLDYVHLARAVRVFRP
ncbi:hypothetical protein EBB79_08485 [Parasedimentitalea marina]|uniref:DUF6950 domain-containing protein n=1 Tax=Parasedimentitalea marina TaxID=2483033 RepID=A0A3T0N1M4_9RHOB|nr:hypothetical protein [Parasedimentitalea marina]AZV77928.1 hypothetical protein EBB79_08485 [Parasedimentitalea marina]